MPTWRRKIGDRGEELACQYYLDKQFILLDRNWRTPGGEIDLIFKKGNDLVFVEVKTRTKNLFGGGELAVNFSKRRKIRRTIELYIKQKDYYEMFPRFDVLVVELIENETKFVLFENVEL